MKIAIAGYGLEGRANLEYLQNKFPEATFTIFDENADLADVPNGVKTVLGADAFDQIRDFDLVMRTAGLMPNKIAQKDKHWSSTREFFAECPAPIIGVTGTKGKGTTCSFIAEILKAANKNVHLIGNIGVPALEVLPHVKPDDIVVYELSSFQLWDMNQSPHVAVMTLIEPDHLDVHENFAEYVEAKSHIFAYQKPDDVAIYNENDALVREMAETSKGQKIPFLNKKFVHIEQGKFYYNTIDICPTDVVKLPGEHNLRNAAAAISAVIATISAPASLGDSETELITNLRKAIKIGLSGFDGLPHRLKFVREIGGVKYYDDSIATTPGSAIAAVKSFDEPKILIIGGHDKGADYGSLGEVIERSNTRQIFAIGANRDKVAQQIGAKTSTPIHKLDNQKLYEIVQIVDKATEPGDVVILSPAAASFDMFRDYQDRGEQFIEAVKDLTEWG
ncbi:UDP-N-acetylmuramoyl-L-alanine--D-glutamate ligase [Candidatus Saccharibacteria bacterium]|nr:UDP-N-acetylmuramoyl-L-alanine--D-glutamate ligase [Candidatus Saccharibacteria bacterium]